MHTEQHLLSGRYVVLNDTTKDPTRDMVVPGSIYHVKDWWDRAYGKSWLHSDGNIAAVQYAIRVGFAKHVPTDDDVVYGHIDGIGHLVHVSELGEILMGQED